MSDLVNTATEVILVLFQGYCLQWFYGTFMVTRYVKWRNSRYLILVFWVVLRLVLGYFWEVDFNNIHVQGKLFVTIALLVSVTMWLYVANERIKLYLAVTFLAINEISWALACMILELSRPLVSVLSWGMEEGYIRSTDLFLGLVRTGIFGLQIIMLAVYGTFLYTGLKSIIRRYKEKNYDIHRTELFFILTPSMVGLLICIMLRMLMVTVEEEVPHTLYERYPGMLLLVPAILLLSLLSILYGIRLFQDMIALHREKSNRIVLEKQMSQIQEHVGEMDRVYTGIRSMRHDIKNQIAVVMQLVDQNMGREGTEIQNYLSGMEQTIRSLEFQYQTGNTVADTILTMKYHEGVRTIPDLELDADQLIFPKECHIHNYDIGVILCNAMDNALEACARLKEGSRKPWIRLSSMERGKLFFLEIENRFNGQIRQDKRREFPQTDKADQAAHGIGMFNIKNAAEKYHGAVDWDVQEDIFVLSVMLKNEKREENKPGL